MGDRFYMQMCKSLKMKPAELIYPHIYAKGKSVGAKGKSSKGALIEIISRNINVPNCSGIFNKLSKADLETIVSNLTSLEVDNVLIPHGRLRKPYEDTIKCIFANININYKNFTINDMKTIISDLLNYQI